MNAGQDHADKAHPFASIRQDGKTLETAVYFATPQEAIEHAKAAWAEYIAETPRSARRADIYAGKIHGRTLVGEDGSPVYDWDEIHVLWDPKLGEEAPEYIPAEATVKTTVARQGNSLVVLITEQARLLGIERGDAVEVTIRRARQN
jgi:Cu/Ag efflux protein CusF